MSENARSRAHELRELIKEAASRSGFDAVGIAPATAAADDRDRLLAWLTRGCHASMHWMARDPERRGDIARLLPGAQSVISLGLNYYAPVDTNDHCASFKVSRYARGQDYHQVLGRKLDLLCTTLAQILPGERFVAQVDTGPVMEKSWAQRAGLGWVGKNGCLVTRSHGSWVFLGEIITTASLAPDPAHVDFCGSCTRCLDACPTDAILEPYVVDSNRCVAYWTIEHRGEIPADMAEAFDGWIFGCDVCQEVCPWNKFAHPTGEDAFAPRADCLCPPVERWANLSAEEFAAEFADSAIRRVGAEGLARNIRVQHHDPLRKVLATLQGKLVARADDIKVDGVDWFHSGPAT